MQTYLRTASQYSPSKTYQFTDCDQFQLQRFTPKHTDEIVLMHT